MKQNFSSIYKVVLLGSDAFSLLLAFSLAYILRVSLDPRPVAMPVKALTYLSLIATLLPIWLGVFSLLGLYGKRVYERRPKEAVRLLLGSLSGVLLLVTFDFFAEEVIFPAKLVPVYATLLGFFVVWLTRTILRHIRLYLHRRDYGVMRVILVGNSEATRLLGRYLSGNPQSGYRVVAVVASRDYLPKNLLGLQFKSLSKAIASTWPHAIIQTDSEDVNKVYNQAIEHHLDYQFIPSHEALFTARHSVELLGAFPIINVHTTPLVGYGRTIKRGGDIVLSSLGLLFSLPFTLLIALLMKLTDFKSPVIFKQRRLTRFNQPISIYKFRTHKRTYNGLSPEEAFAKMGRPELARSYRKNGDYLQNDPRVTRLGHFLRQTSLDELPQLINVLKGDISLVGPRALVPSELENYEFKNLILSVRSGLTGLAQISGRKDISFEERRKLDMYYVQNWSIWLDLQIIIRTIFAILTGRGAK